MTTSSSATVADPPPKPPPEKPSVHSLLESELVMTNLFIQKAAADFCKFSLSSSPTTDLQDQTMGNVSHFKDSLAPKRHPVSQLIQSFPAKAADLGQTVKSSSPATFMNSPPTGVHVPESVLMASKPTFAEITKTGSAGIKRKAGPSLHTFGQPPPLPGARKITENGVEILEFDDEAMDILTTSLKWALVGKFSHKLPHFRTVSQFISSLHLRGRFELSWLSHREILIVLNDEVDYALLWTKGLWVFDGCQMRILKWTPTFNIRDECPIIPVWASLPGLPVQLFEKRALHLLASQLGKPVMVDSLTATRKRAMVARVCVEINLLAPVTNIVNLRIDDIDIKQPVCFEDMPSYCVHCKHIGHDQNKCFVKFEELRTAYDEAQAQKKNKKKSKGKEKVEHDGEIQEDGDVFKSTSAVLDSSETLPTTAFVLIHSNNGDRKSEMEIDGEDGEILEDGSHFGLNSGSGGVAVHSAVAPLGGVNDLGASGSVRSANLNAYSGAFVPSPHGMNSKQLDDDSSMTSTQIGLISEVEDDVPVTSSHLVVERDAVSTSAKIETGFVVSDVCMPPITISATPSSVPPVGPSAVGQPISIVEDDGPDDYSSAIVSFLTPFGVGSNLEAVFESDPVALIKFLDKHPNMELYWDENSVLQSIDNNRGKYINYLGDNTSTEQVFIDYPAPPNQIIVFAEPLQTIVRPRNYYPDMGAMRANLIQESDASECSREDSDDDEYEDTEDSDDGDYEDIEDTLGIGTAGYNSDYGGRITRSMVRNGTAEF